MALLLGLSLPLGWVAGDLPALAASPPTVTSVMRNQGPTAGGTEVTITGTNFTGANGATAVKFGSSNAASYTVNSPTSITAVSPAGTGTVDVTVTTEGGTTPTSSADQFTYVPPPTVAGVSPTAGPEGGGTSVTVSGTNFTGATVVQFGAANAASYTVNSATSITAVSPAGAGAVDVTVTTPGGTSSTSPADQFTYLAPTVVVVSPPSGSQPIVVVPQSPATTPKKGAVVCTLKVGGVHLPGKAKRNHNKAKAGAGTVTVLVNCDQSATVTIRGQLIERIGKKPKHGKQRTRLVPFGSAVASVNASVQKALTLRLPKPAVIGLEHKKAQKVAFTIIANR
jgi:IPT/TIG domain